MFAKTYHATHPDMMFAVSNDDLRDRYLMQGLFQDGQIVLTYNHAERFVVGGVVATSPIKLPDQTEPASAAGSGRSAVSMAETPAAASEAAASSKRL